MRAIGIERLRAERENESRGNAEINHVERAPNNVVITAHKHSVDIQEESRENGECI